MTVNIYSLDGYFITGGLQSAAVCDEAIQVARSIACVDGRNVVVEDSRLREAYQITPHGERLDVPRWWRADWDMAQ